VPRYTKEELLNKKLPFKYWADEDMKKINFALNETINGVEDDYGFIFK
jgi:hypothetical protein